MGREPMIVKALALICTLHAVGEHSCSTVIFEEEFKSVDICTKWLMNKRLYHLPSNQKVVLDDCIKTERGRL
tara:strand:+ start:21 stop:236 length:216 start_codon:yes stop_codon:yes gene_type:complete